MIGAGTLIETKDSFFDEDNNAYAQLESGGWIVVRKGALVACEKVDAPPKVRLLSLVCYNDKSLVLTNVWSVAL